MVFDTVLDAAMKDFFLNLTQVLESNSKIYWSIIVGIVLCLVLYVTEIIHIQSVYPHLPKQDPTVVRTVIDAIAQKYQWVRIGVMILAVLMSVVQYRSTRKRLPQ